MLATKINKLEIYGREWWRDPRNGGGGYFVAKIYINDIEIHKTELRRGWNDQYIWDSLKWLQTQGLNMGESTRDLIDYCQKNNIELLTSKTEGTRQRDLLNW